MTSSTTTNNLLVPTRHLGGRWTKSQLIHPPRHCTSRTFRRKKTSRSRLEIFSAGMVW